MPNTQLHLPRTHSYSHLQHFCRHRARTAPAPLSRQCHKEHSLDMHSQDSTRHGSTTPPTCQCNAYPTLVVCTSTLLGRSQGPPIPIQLDSTDLQPARQYVGPQNALCACGDKRILAAQVTIRPSKRCAIDCHPGTHHRHTTRSPISIAAIRALPAWWQPHTGCLSHDRPPKALRDRQVSTDLNREAS